MKLQYTVSSFSGNGELETRLYPSPSIVPSENLFLFSLFLRHIQSSEIKYNLTANNLLIVYASPLYPEKLLLYALSGDAERPLARRLLYELNDIAWIE